MAILLVVGIATLIGIVLMLVFRRSGNSSKIRRKTF